MYMDKMYQVCLNKTLVKAIRLLLLSVSYLLVCLLTNTAQRIHYFNSDTQ